MCGVGDVEVDHTGVLQPHDRVRRGPSHISIIVSDTLVHYPRSEGLTTGRPVSRAMTWWIETYPVTCWISGGMKAAFEAVHRHSGSKRLAAIFAILAGHVMPFAGAGVTWLAIGITPHLLDNVLVQPFGMTEDLATITMNQILHGNVVVAQRGFFALHVILNIITASGMMHGWIQTPRQQVKAAIVAALGLGIYCLLEAQERGDVLQQNLWTAYVLKLMVFQSVGSPVLANAGTNLLAWAFDWEQEEQGHDDTHFVQLADDEEAEAPVHDVKVTAARRALRQPGEAQAVHGDGVVLRRAARRGAGTEDNDFLPGQDEGATAADNVATAAHARNRNYVDAPAPEQAGLNFGQAFNNEIPAHIL